MGRVLGWMEGEGVCSGEGVGVDGRGGCVCVVCMLGWMEVPRGESGTWHVTDVSQMPLFS